MGHSEMERAGQAGCLWALRDLISSDLHHLHATRLELGERDAGANLTQVTFTGERSDSWGAIIFDDRAVLEVPDHVEDVFEGASVGLLNDFDFIPGSTRFKGSEIRRQASSIARGL